MDETLAFEALKDRVRGLERWSLLERVMRKLDEISRVELTAAAAEGWVPWNLLLLARWTIEYGGRLSLRLRLASDQDLRELAERVSQIVSREHIRVLESSSSMKGGTAPVDYFRRLLSLTQLPFQRSLDAATVSRVTRLFTEEQRYGRYPIGPRFARATRLDPATFHELLLCLWVAVRQRLPLDVDFTAAGRAYPLDERRAFISAMSMRLEHADRDIAKRSRVSHPALRHLELGPLVRRPLVIHEGRVSCMSPVLLAMGYDCALYDRLKESDREPFCDAFGTVFEAFLDERFSEAGVAVIPERTLKAALGTSKVVDFVIIGDGAVVLVEAKALEVPPTVQLQPHAHEYSQRYSLITKAAVQFSVVAEAIVAGKLSSVGVPAVRIEHIYGLTVTYAEQYFGPARRLWDDFLGAEVAKALGRVPAFVPENLVYTGVDDLEELLRLSDGSAHGAVAAIARASFKNTNAGESRLTLHMHLQRDVADGLLREVVRRDPAFEAVMKRVATRVGTGR